MPFLDRMMTLASLSMLVCTGAYAQDMSQAGQAVTNAVQASGHASASAAHGIAASGQVTSALIAVPFLASGAVMGSVGSASTRIGQESMRAATAPIGTPLPITDEAITVVSPAEALKPKSPSL